MFHCQVECSTYSVFLKTYTVQSYIVDVINQKYAWAPSAGHWLCVRGAQVTRRGRGGAAPALTWLQPQSCSA